LINEIKKYRREREIRVFFSYLEDILTNYLVLSFNPGTVGIAVEDGVLNYYNHTIRTPGLKKVIAKYLLSNLYGIRFKWYKGHSSGIDYNHVVKQLVRIPELSVRPGKSEKLITPVKKIDRFTDTMLIIGQEAYENILGSKTYYSMLHRMFDFAAGFAGQKKVEKIYYKPHRHGKRIPPSFFEEKFKNIPYVIEDITTPVEDLFFNKLRPKYLVTFNSSAVINIKTGLENRDDLNVFAFMKKNDELRKIFNYLNAQIIDLD
jgi:hypothetical protein